MYWVSILGYSRLTSERDSCQNLIYSLPHCLPFSFINILDRCLSYFILLYSVPCSSTPYSTLHYKALTCAELGASQPCTIKGVAAETNHLFCRRVRLLGDQVLDATGVFNLFKS